ncbi:MAG: glutamate racemase [Verrucomicrobiales bacterium]
MPPPAPPPPLSPTAPIGVFDSGVGGLSVLREIHARLPNESLLYIADSAHVPYGTKSPEFIVARSHALGRFLLDQGAKALVIACNTATAAAAASLRTQWPEVPIVGMEPAVKPAVAATRSGHIGVLATVGTLHSARFAALLDDFARHVRVVVQPAPGLPEAVEAGALDTPETRALVARHLQPLIDARVDTIVLGCTHYPFLKPIIAEIAGPLVALIDTGAAVARQLERRLTDCSRFAPPTTSPAPARFWTTGHLATSQLTLQRLWHPDAEFHPLAGG